MTLEVDTSLRFLDAERRVALVEAVATADPHDEARWLEWKSDLDLDTHAHQFKVAKTILGFANRTEEQADTWAEGFAYLLVGVEPGNLCGTTRLDISVVDARLRRWVGSGEHSPRWTAGWVTVKGRAVLVIEVAPPLPGDPLFPLRQHFGNVRDGSVFVRRQASSDPADSAEVLQLSDRAARRRRLALSVKRTDSTAMSAVELRPEVVTGFLDTEEEVCMESLLDYRRQRDRKEQERREQARKNNPLRGAALFKAIGDVANPMGGVRPTGFGQILGERRTEQEFEEQVARYVEDCRDTLNEVVISKLISRAHIQVRLRIVNPTERHIPAVRVVATIDGPIFVATEDRPSDLPPTPRPYGTDSEPSITASLRALERMPLPPLAMDRAHDYAEEIQRPDGIEIRWPATELPALEEIDLEPIEIAILAPLDGAHLTLKWRATSSGLDGRVSGEVEIPIRSTDPGIDGLVSLVHGE
ncbi:MAG: AlbA family DNA-binding domain-containing protein [Acidimicrobiales bacterium]